MSTTDASPPSPTLVAIRAQHLRPLSTLLAGAFADDPGYAYLFPDLASRVAGLRDFFMRNLRIHLAYGCTYALEDASHALVGTVTVRPPGGVDVSTLTLLRRGLLPFALAHGAAAVKRLFWLKNTYQALEAEIAGGEPHRYVHMMAAAPASRGMGIGTDLLTRVLRRTAHLSPRTVLNTHSERNVVFYERAGFRVTDERILRPPGGTPYTTWSMRSS